MSRAGRILMVDDDERWRRTVGNLLLRAGFSVLGVGTSHEARELLKTSFFHLLVLDIQLDAGDESNAEGMHLLEEMAQLNLVGSTQVIMVSGWGTLERMREAFSRYLVADFFVKDKFKGSDFVARVHEVFADIVNINLNLEIQWQAGTVDEAVLNLRLDKNRIRKNTPEQTHLSEQLDDLLCRLFHQAEEILVRPLKRGQSGTGVLMIQPFYGFGAAQSRVVKYGEVDGIYAENGNFEKYVKNFVGGGRSTTIHGLRRTPLLAGIMYSFLGATNEQAESFGDYYARAPVNDIQEVLDRLFLVTCQSWYANRSQLKPLDLTKHYQQRMGFTPENLERALFDKLKINLGKKDTLTFTSLGERPFTNPIALIREQKFIRTTYECITHGDLNASNIFVDTDRHAWLIDFGSTGPGHILRDVAELDSMIRFQLLAGASATLEERLALEESLINVRLSDVRGSAPKFQTGNQALSKTFEVILHLRSIAGKLITLHRDTDLSEYDVALFYYSLNTIRFYALDTVQRQHALLCSSLLADHITP